MGRGTIQEEEWEIQPLIPESLSPLLLLTQERRLLHIRETPLHHLTQPSSGQHHHHALLTRWPIRDTCSLEKRMNLYDVLMTIQDYSPYPSLSSSPASSRPPSRGSCTSDMRSPDDGDDFNDDDDGRRWVNDYQNEFDAYSYKLWSDPWKMMWSHLM